MTVVNNLPGGGGGKAVQVWTGSVTTGDITVDLSKYKYVAVVSKSSTGSDAKPRGVALVPVGGSGYIGTNYTGGQNVYQTSKKLTVTTSKVTVSSTNNATYNSNNVIIAIYGIKSDLDMASAWQ